VYEYDDLAGIVEKNYRDYIEKPKRDGTQRKEVGFRWHDLGIFTEEDYKKMNNWEPIERLLSDLSTPGGW